MHDTHLICLAARRSPQLAGTKPPKPRTTAASADAATSLTSNARIRPRRPRPAAERRRPSLGSRIAAFAATSLLAAPSLIAATSLLAASAAPVFADRVRADTATHDPGSGSMMLHDHETAIDAVLLDTRFDLNVQGMLGELRVSQTFRNTTGRWLSGRYLFPLPGDAAIRGLELRIGERHVIGQVMEREEARESFEVAEARGQSAGLVEQQRPNLFTADVANIAPGAEIQVELDVLLVVAASAENLSLTLPTTLTPRYARPGTEVAANNNAPILPADFITGPRLSLQARLAPLADLSLVTSPTHRFDVTSDSLLLTDVPMDRDLVLQWPLPDTGSSGVADAAFVARHRDDRYAQIFMSPLGSSVSDSASPTRELILVIDKSGSMAGVSMTAARKAVQSALDALRPGDRFNVIAFNDSTDVLFGRAKLATTANLAAGRRFVRRLEADGGTEMGPALAQALHTDAVSDDSPSLIRQVVFLTDGSIVDDDALLRQIRQDIGRARLFTVGIGSAPNDWFLDKAAEIGGGTALAVRDIDDVSAAVGSLLGKLESPVLTDISVQFEGGAESYPTRIPDLYADSPLLVVARLPRDASTGRHATVTGWQGERRFRRKIVLPVAEMPTPLDARASTNNATAEPDGNDTRVRTDAATTAPALAMHWARTRIASLLDEQRDSRIGERHRDAITELALNVGLVTPYTSFLAVDTTPARPSHDDIATADVANLMPAGNTMLSVSLPQGAAGIDTLGALGLLSGALGILSLAIRRRLAVTEPAA